MDIEFVKQIFPFFKYEKELFLKQKGVKDYSC